MSATCSISVWYSYASYTISFLFLQKSVALHILEIQPIQALVFQIFDFKITLYNKTSFHDLVTPNTIAL